MLATPNNIDIVRCKFEALEDCLTEKGRRLWAATEAMSYGRGGIHLVCKATGISNQNGTIPSVLEENITLKFKNNKK